ncbi:MAG: hypothetical protein QF486_01820 [Candidatus Woesearchaeota archaeon]|nr:hypothetical protein [Candidatus Woesearchaeota archaeon]MDP7181049.1 hypothetical protein [Candidatus Woesearchaeota archaeon]MDP7198330.1 hypothetical protein [Candidatus Woesearchaeota archaeon]MDP7467432.1 hypothetical protein [Candidatus Woesearchaeota archaeon]MDP7647659.1 hypothetical protein [Candidatus Woesearchaeota archaeon]
MLLVLASTAVALQESLLISGPSDVSLLACSTQQKTILVTNNGQITSNYRVFHRGPSYSSISPAGFILTSGASQTVTHTFSVPCNAPSDALSTTVTTVLGNTQTLNQRILVAVPKNAQLTPQTPQAFTTPCEPADYSVHVRNIGSFPDTFSLSAESNIPLSSSTAQVTLQPNQVSAVPIVVIPTSCTRAGRYTVNLVAKAANTGIEERAGVLLDISNPGIPALTAPSARIDLNARTLPFTIQNTGQRTSYTLSVQGLSWASVSPSAITLDAGQSTTVNLNLVPANQPQGLYKTNIVVVGAKQYNFPLQLNLKPPTFWELYRIPILMLVLLLLVCAAVAVVFVQHTNTPEYKENQKKRKEEMLARLKEKLAVKRQNETDRLRAKQQKEKELQQAKAQKQKDRDRKISQAKLARERIQTKRESDKLKREQERRAKKAAKARRNPIPWLKILWVILLLAILGLLIFAGAKYWSAVTANMKYVYAALIALAVVLFLLWLRILIPKIKAWVADVRRKRDLHKIERKKEREHQLKQREEEKQRRHAEREAERKGKEQERQQRVEHRQKALLSHWETRRSEQLKERIDKEYRKMNYVVGKQDVVQHVRQSRAGWLILLGVLIILIGFGLRFKEVLIRNQGATLLAIGLVALLYLFTLILRTHITRIKVPVVVNKASVSTPWELSNMNFEANSPIKDLEIKLRRSKRNLTFLPPNGKPYKYYRVGANVREEHLGKAVVTFKVPKSFAKNADVRVAQLTSKWEDLSITRVSQDAQYEHYQARTDKLTGTYVVYLKEKPVQVKAPKRSNLLMPLLIGVVIALLLISLPQPSDTVVEGIPEQTWRQDEVHALNLSTFFNDPDGDSLTYDAQPTRHIRIDVFRDTATFVPDDGWHGREFTTITASDGKGGVATSNTVVLKVQSNLLKASYRSILQGALAIILVILVLIYGLRNGKKANDKQNGNANNKPKR